MSGYARPSDFESAKQTKLQEKSNELLSANTTAVNKFNSSSSVLAWVMIFVMIVQVGVAIGQIYFAFKLQK